tara:strand:+ start:1652 stop:1882 length:231 start_codon:yes stop_codon:yes gene_type:complete
MTWWDIIKEKKLTDKQKKIDLNHNGVIDAQDFHIMNGSDKEEKMDGTVTTASSPSLFNIRYSKPKKEEDEEDGQGN